MIRKYGPFLSAGLLVIGLALLGSYIWRPITIQDGGKQQEIRAAALTVAQVIQAAGVRLAPEDQVVPPLDHWVSPDGRIAIRRGTAMYIWAQGQLQPLPGQGRIPGNRLAEAGLRLFPGDRVLWNGVEIDPGQPLPAGPAAVLQPIPARPVIVETGGQRQVVYSNGPTAAHALWQAGIRVGPADLVSTDPGSRFAGPEAGVPVIAYQPAQVVNLHTAEKRLRSHATAGTVGQALAEAGMALQGLDYSQPGEDEPVPASGTVRVVRVREEIHLKSAALPFERQSVPDANLAAGQTRVIRPGQPGVQVTRERARFEDGQEVGRVVDSDWTASEPVAQKVAVSPQVTTQSLESPDGSTQYWRSVRVYATSYSPCQQGTGRCSWSTSSGQRLGKGVIAVTLAWYRLIAGLQVYIPGYGTGVIGDVGGGIPGTPWIDLGFDEENFQPITGWVTMYFLNPPPADTSWTLP